MTDNPFKKAVKHEANAGPSGSGKTYTSLAVGTALANGGSVAVVDTEHGSASKYADLFDFDVMELAAPFHPARFVRAIQEAQKAGYSVVILDSMSHAWNGTGGLLEIVDKAAAKFKGNTYMAWSEGTPIQNQLIEAITGADIHVIAAMRSKQEYIITTNSKGQSVPQKVGMAPVQRDSFEYEFDVYLDMDIKNNAIVSKTRCPALTGEVISKPGADLAETLREWLGGVAVEKPEPKPEQSSDGNAPDTEQVKDAVIAALDSVPPPNSQVIEARDWLEAEIANGRTILQNVFRAAVTSKKYTAQKHAQNAVTPNEETGNTGYEFPEGFEIKPSQPITRAGALTVFDWLMDRKAEEA
jgi:hypothetical protein